MTEKQRRAIRCGFCVYVERLSKTRSIPSASAPTLFCGGKKKEGWDLNDIRFALGHKKVETTIKYLGENNERLIEATDQYYSNNEDYTKLQIFCKGRRITLAVLKIVPVISGKISEKLKEEISLVTNGEAKYYNRLYKFFSIQIYSVLQILTMKRENVYGVS